MEPTLQIPIPKCLLIILSQLYELEQKFKKHYDPANCGRNIGKMKAAFAEEGLPAGDGQGRIRLVYEDPMGQLVKETRTDLEVTIAGPGIEDLVVVQVIKPIVRVMVMDGVSQVVQKGVVIVESHKGRMSS